MTRQDSASQPRSGRHLRLVRFEQGDRAGIAARPDMASPPMAPDPQQRSRLTACPDCQSDLAVLRIIPGRAADYWTLRCTRCGGIHLDIVGASEVVQDSGDLSA